MSSHLQSIHIKNYRSLADVELELRPINVLFGPNGAGKSSFLDVIWFVRDCANRGVDQASSFRSHGIGMLYDGAEPGDEINIAIRTDAAAYELSFELVSGRIEPFAGERLTVVENGATLIERRAGSERASFRDRKTGDMVGFPLREPEKISLGRYLDFESGYPAAFSIDRLLKNVRYYHCRQFNLWGIGNRGSETGRDAFLSPSGDNLWSVLRSVEGRREVDGRYDSIMHFMKRAFPDFNGAVVDATGPTALYGSFLYRNRRREIMASGVSDGHIQLLLLLTALFAENRNPESLILFDEPEVSLHPWALAVLAEAITAATTESGKQVLIATHSPVLLSQFPVDDVVATEVSNGKTVLQRLSDKVEIQDLLVDYAAGSLYMAQAVAAQAPDALNAVEAQ
jgi:predicted ATPase